MKCLHQQVKMHWVHENYWQPGPAGNDIQKTNVPNLRMRFRYDNHSEEVSLMALWYMICTQITLVQSKSRSRCVGHLADGYFPSICILALPPPIQGLRLAFHL